MRAVKGKNTSPELNVRRLLHQLGYRYRLHDAGLPGKPDLVFTARRKVVFIHGCFWHGHNCPRGARTPKTNTEYWRRKISRNRERDTAHLKALADQSWGVHVIWECELGDDRALTERLCHFLGASSISG